MKYAERPFIYRVEALTDEGRYITVAEERTIDLCHEALDQYVERFDPSEKMTYRILEITVYQTIPSRLVRKEQLRLLRQDERDRKTASRR